MKGVVEAVSTKQTRNGAYNHGFKLDGSWYSVFLDSNQPPANKGDTVEFEYTQKGNFNNIQGEVKVLERASNQKGDDRQDSIMRQSAMGYAATIVATAGVHTGLSVDEMADEVLRIADEKFMPYASKGVRGNVNQDQHEHVQSYQDDPDDAIPF